MLSETGLGIRKIDDIDYVGRTQFYINGVRQSSTSLVGLSEASLITGTGELTLDSSLTRPVYLKDFSLEYEGVTGVGWHPVQFYDIRDSLHELLVTSGAPNAWYHNANYYYTNE